MAAAPFTLYWHRAGNDARALDAAVDAAREARTLAGRPVRHGVECDLKWTVSPGASAPLLYLHHGPTGLERLSARTVVRRAAAGKLLLLDDALARPGAADLWWMVEVKRGHGPTASAIDACVTAFERIGARERLLFVSSSLAAVAAIRRAHPRVATGLFVSWVLGDGRVLQVPKVEVAAGLRLGLFHAPSSLGDVHLVVCTNPLVAGRTVAVDGARAPIARSPDEAEAHAAAGLAGAFAYFPPRAFVR